MVDTQLAELPAFYVGLEIITLLGWAYHCIMRLVNINPKIESARVYIILTSINLAFGVAAGAALINGDFLSLLEFVILNKTIEGCVQGVFKLEGFSISKFYEQRGRQLNTRQEPCRRAGDKRGRA